MGILSEAELLEIYMSKQTHASHLTYSRLAVDVEGFDSLAKLALDLRWSWNHAADEVWRQLDPTLRKP